MSQENAEVVRKPLRTNERSSRTLDLRLLLRDRVDDLAHLVRPRSRLADHGHLGLGHLHHLGAGGVKREQRPDALEPELDAHFARSSRVMRGLP